MRRREAPSGRGDATSSECGSPSLPAGWAWAGGCSITSKDSRASTAPSEARLETGDVLGEAIALYRSAGYAEVAPFNDEPFADRWFAKPLR